MAKDDLSKWVGGDNVIKIKKWGNGANNSRPVGRRKNSFLSVMQRALHQSALARGTKMNPSGVPFV